MRDAKEFDDEVPCFIPECSDAEAALPECQICGVYLDLHQPDSELPDRLLATCSHCKTWYLLIASQELVRITPRRTSQKRAAVRRTALGESLHNQIDRPSPN